MTFMEKQAKRKTFLTIFQVCVFLVFIGFFIFWLGWTPVGFWGKLDSIAYAICHRIADRSFFFYGEQMPLCSRCTGMYLGALAGLIDLFFQPRKAGYPSKKILFVLLGFFFLFAIDGINSALHFFPGVHGLYTPQNWLRLLTGSGMGIVIAVMLVTVFNMAVWKDSIPESTMDNWTQFFPLAGSVTVLDLLVLSQRPFLLFPLAILSTLTVIGILSLAYSVLLIMLWKRDNTFRSIRQYLPWLMGGLGCAFIQIFLMDALRLAITGIWVGFTI
jgi:uncharacterized membrane protein